MKLILIFSAFYSDEKEKLPTDFPSLLSSFLYGPWVLRGGQMAAWWTRTSSRDDKPLRTRPHVFLLLFNLF